MLPLGGPVTEFVATLGAVIAGGGAIGSLIGAGFSAISRAGRQLMLEFAGLGAVAGGVFAVTILIFEQAVGVR